MGEVWKARDTRLDRTVAIKRLKAEFAERFEKEARAIAALNHPNICHLYDIGPDYLVMEFVDGKTLRGPVSVDETVRLAIQIAAALEEAHYRGIIHRDLKPGNIMITEKGVAKLLDFGLAKLMIASESLVTGTIEGTVVGTAAYMAPEQAEGKQLDARSDIFSFGAVLYEMLSGRRAFDGDSTAQVLSAILRDDPRPLQTQEALDRIVMRCLAKQAGHRFQTMSELKSALEKIPTKSVAMERSIAVLPFSNMSGDKENEYFSDGLAEEIINGLAHIPGLKVTARTSAFAFRGKEQDIRGIAEALGVRTILEGSVRRSGTRVRVTAQLINAADGYHLWSERYDREMADVFAIQDDIAQAIAVSLEAKLSIAQKAPRRYKPKLPAYEALLKGRHYMMQTTQDSLARGKECYEQAMALDPQFALAHTEFGFYLVSAAIGGQLPAHHAMPLVRTEAQKALDIDPSLPEAQAMLGVVAALYDYDWKAADRRFRLAMSYEPVDHEIRFLYAVSYLMPTGDWSEAVVQLRRGLQEDPLNAWGRFYLGQCLLGVGKHSEAEAAFEQILELNPSFGPAMSLLGMIHFIKGQFDEALQIAERAYSYAPLVPITAGNLAGLLALRGGAARAQEILQKLGETMRTEYQLAYSCSIPTRGKWTRWPIGLRRPLNNAIRWHRYFCRVPSVRRCDRVAGEPDC